MPRSTHVERHHTQRIGWLRAAVLGAFWSALALAVTALVGRLFGTPD
ncbi:MAG: hypothetical protein ACXWZ4_12810 [Gemmatirosa sp.]